MTCREANTAEGSRRLLFTLFNLFLFFFIQKAIPGIIWHDSLLLAFAIRTLRILRSSLHGARVSIQLSSSARKSSFGIRQLETPTQCLGPPPTDIPPNAREPSSSRLHAAMTERTHKVTNNDLPDLRPLPQTLLITLVTHLPTRSLTLTPILFITRLTSRVVRPITLDLPGMYGRLFSCRLQNRAVKNLGGSISPFT